MTRDRSGLVRRYGTRAARPHHPSLAGGRPRQPRPGPEARLLPVAGISDRPAVQRRGRQSAAAANSSGPRSAISASISTGCVRAEPDAALGNGGLGRLAACLMESMASLGIPACGYGIRYDHGLFRQVIRDGWQQEHPEQWLSFGNPWEFARPEVIYDIQFGGRVEKAVSSTGRSARCGSRRRRSRRSPTTPRSSAGAGGTSTRCGCGRPAPPTRCASTVFNEGDHVGALSAQARAEAISKILYPSDDTPSGRELRLRQEYFFVSASLQDIVRRHSCTYCSDLLSLPERAAIQLNDTHPSIAIAELMRLLVDLHNVPWDVAWQITVGTFSYTNHTLLPEALESWPVRCSSGSCRGISKSSTRSMRSTSRRRDERGRLDAGAAARDSRSSTRAHGRRVRMGHLAFVGSHRVNGVSALHTKLMRETRVRRSAPALSRAHRQQDQRHHLSALAAPGQSRADPAAAARPAAARCSTTPRRSAASRRIRPTTRRCGRLAAVKRANKMALEPLRRRATRRCRIDPGALFDVHIKRIHEYKRQLLNLLDTVARYHAIRADPGGDWVPRVKIFAGKAAAELCPRQADHQAGQRHRRRWSTTIPATRDLLRLVFLPNYNVSLAEMIIPAADLSEQISTAGMEASGTGNMKLALNGALTIGTLDGANIEIREHVGAENIFIFGLRAEEVAARRQRGLDASEAIAASPELAEAIDAMATGSFSPTTRTASPVSPTGCAIRPVYDRGRFRRLPRGSARGRRAVARTRAMGPSRPPQHRPDGLVFLRPHDRRIRRRHLGYPGQRRSHLRQPEMSGSPVPSRDRSTRSNAQEAGFHFLVGPKFLRTGRIYQFPLADHVHVVDQPDGQRCVLLDQQDR